MSVTTDNTVSSVLSGLARSEPIQKTLMQDEQNRFLTLLTTQLRNQDPMNPLDNADLTMQLAQMSTVDGIERLNKLVESLMNSKELADNTALIGHGVLVAGKGLGLTEAGAIGGFDLNMPADKVTVTIYDSSGRVVTKLEFSDVDAGSHNYLWDGLAEDGSEAAQGMYTVSVSASLGDTPVGVNALQFGPVTSVIRGPNGADLQVGGLGIFKLDDVKQVL
ncbi:MAG: flagellar hook assembly protein FlgD [Betaproteobacteria bacterium]|jgi:flagellar basal-body rod modification protein FlgD|nr:flagellar hook assembly protein FlgD [Betaproteobacteria bacterium]